MKPHHAAYWLKATFIAVTTASLFINLGVNDIWNPNEGFYADAVRNMLRNGNLLDFIFNGAYRFNKPPVTYWSIGMSCSLFGLNEFAIRLPMVLFALGTILLTWMMGKTLYGSRAGFWGAVAMALSIQFVINSHYATPEIPLTFFFTLTMFLFIKGYLLKKRPFIWGAYLSLGFTVLTKGYPYFIIIGAIILVFLVFRHRFRFHMIRNDLHWMQLLPGIMISLIIGLSWPLYSYLKFGHSFLQVLDSETLDRAFRYQNNWITELFFFPSVILWGFLPYSIVFVLSSLGALQYQSMRQKLLFPLAWIGIMLIIFTIARFKLPTYFIQAHAAMAVVTGWYISTQPFSGKYERVIRLAGFFFPGVLILALIFLLIWLFRLNPAFYLLPVSLLVGWIMILLPSKVLKNQFWNETCLFIFPFLSMLILFFVFTMQLLPSLESMRPYKEIGLIINKNVPDKSIPLVIENRFIYNMPYYAQRKVLQVTREQLKDSLENKAFIALIEKSDSALVEKSTILWQGKLYKGRSEAVFVTFLKKYYDNIHGDRSGFGDYLLVCHP